MTLSLTLFRSKHKPDTLPLLGNNQSAPRRLSQMMPCSPILSGTVARPGKGSPVAHHPCHPQHSRLAGVRALGIPVSMLGLGHLGYAFRCLGWSAWDTRLEIGG